MAFKNGMKEFLLNSVSNYPVKFYSSAGVEQTALADIASDAVRMNIQGFGDFSLDSLRDVKALRGASEVLETKSLISDDLTVTAPSAGVVNIYFNFKITDFSYSSAYSRNLRQFGVEDRYQVVVGTADTKNTVAAKLYNQMVLKIKQYANPQDLPVIAVIPSGATVAGTYTDGTAFSLALTADYNDDITGTGLTKPVGVFTSITAASGASALLNFVAEGNQITFQLAIQGDDYDLAQTTAVGSLTTVASQFEGRGTAEWLEQNFVLQTRANNEPYFKSMNNQLPIDGCLYSNIHFSTRKEASEVGGLSAINTVNTRELGFDLFVKEDATNLDGTTGVIAKILTFLAKDGKSVNGYEFYNQAYKVPGEATGDTVLSGADSTAWNEAVQSGVIRAGIDGVTPQNVADVADFVDDVQGS